MLFDADLQSGSRIRFVLLSMLSLQVHLQRYGTTSATMTLYLIPRRWVLAIRGPQCLVLETLEGSQHL